MIDRITAYLYWPILVGACIGLAVAAGGLFIGEPLRQLVQPVTLALLPLTVFSFLIMLCDKKTRRAVNAFNFYVRDHPDELKAKCQELGLLQRIFGPDPNYPGPTHQIIFRIAGMVMMIAVLAKRQEIAMLAFESAFLAGLGAMMMLKRNGWGQPD